MEPNWLFDEEEYEEHYTIKENTPVYDPDNIEYYIEIMHEQRRKSLS